MSDRDEIERLRAEVARVTAERDALRIELERERMRLSACGVVAMSNTRQTAEENRQVSDEYKSASFDEVCAAVDREMALRERVAEIEAQPADRDLRERLVCAIWPEILRIFERTDTTHNNGANWELVKINARDRALTEADAMIAAMRKGEADGR